MLRTEAVRREFHRCSVAADAVNRWECLEHFDFQRYSPPCTPIEGERFLLPYQVVTMDWDWDWNLGPGRRPLYHRFVMPSLCHWRASADLMVARKLMPNYDWLVVTAEKHTAVMAPAEQLIWDPTYFALEVSAQSALDSMFGSDLSSTDFEIYEEEFPFSPFTVEVIHLFDLLDGYPEAERPQIVKGFMNLWKTDAPQDAANEKVAL